MRSSFLGAWVRIPLSPLNTKGAVDMSMAPFKFPYKMTPMKGCPLGCDSAHPLRASLAACFQRDACDAVLDHVADCVLCVEGHVREHQYVRQVFQD